MASWSRVNNVPFEIEMGEPEDIAPVAIHLHEWCRLRSERARPTPWMARNLCVEPAARTSHDYGPQRHRVEADEIAANFDKVGVEAPSLYDDLERRMTEMAEHARKES